MRLLVISAPFPPMRAGESEHAAHTSLRLAARGVDVTVLTTKGASTTDFPPLTMHAVMEDWSWREMPRMAGLMRRVAPDAVLLFYTGWIYKYHPMITFAASLSHRILPRAPFVIELGLAEGANATGLASRIVRKIATLLVGKADVDWELGTLLRDSDAVISMSTHQEDLHVQRLPSVKQRTAVVPLPPLMHIAPANGGETRRAIRESFGVRDDAFLLAFYGYIYPDKGVETLFRALKIVRETHANVRLVMIGGTEGGDRPETPYYREIKTLPDTLGISDSVIWTGAYDSSSDFASRCFLGADACVLPFTRGVTLYRSSVVASAAHAVPVITTRGDDIEPQFRDGVNVLLAPPEDPVAVARHINSLIESAPLRQRISEGGKQLSDELFSWETTLDRTMELLTKRR